MKKGDGNEKYNSGIRCACTNMLMVACQPSIDQAQADYCESAGEFAPAVAQFRSINATSTKAEAEDALSNLERAWNDLNDSAVDYTEAQLSSLENALDDMRNTIQAIPDDATLAETEGMIKQASLATMAEAVEIFTTTCTYGQGE